MYMQQAHIWISPEPGPEHGVTPVVELPALFEVGPQVGVEVPGQGLGCVVQDEQAVSGRLLTEHSVEGGPDLRKKVGIVGWLLNQQTLIGNDVKLQ